MAADKLANKVVPLPVFVPVTVAGLPSAADNKYAYLLVTDAATNAIPCWSDGTDWKRFDTGATVS